MSDILNPVSEAEESLSFDIPEDSGPRKSKFSFDPGTYRARCVDLSGGKTAAGDNKVVFEFLLLEGPGEGTTIRSHIPVEKLFWKLDKTAQAFGIQTPKGAKKINLSRGAIVGKDVTLDLTQRSYNGKDSMDIKNVFAADDVVGSASQGSLPF